MSIWDRIKEVADPERALLLAMSGVIEATATRYAMGDDTATWQAGEPLRLLLAGYVGTRNTGADVRVEEMIRQLRHVLGHDQVQMSVVSNNLELSAGYFRGCRQMHLPAAFPGFLYRECPQHHGVVACEGSMFKSKFSNALTTFMAGALGMANAEHKLSVGYGAEAGGMDRNMQRFVERQCAKSLVICRNEPSTHVLERLGVRTAAGADTAWTFEPAPAAVGEQLLRDAGWDGKTPVLAVCPINPYWWPVKPDVAKAVARKVGGGFGLEHYRAFYFHTWNDDKERKLNAYLDGIAGAIERFRAEREVFPILVGMEQLDRDAAERLNTKLSSPVPLFVSDTYDMYQLVSVLRRCRAMVSSRYHAMVTSMPGLVPSGGLTMDERIRNLMIDRGQPDLFLEVDDPDLEAGTFAMIEKLWDDGDAVAAGIRKALPLQLELMGQMGRTFAEEVQRVYPDFALPDLGTGWEAHLPPMSHTLTAALEAA